MKKLLDSIAYAILGFPVILGTVYFLHLVFTNPTTLIVVPMVSLFLWAAYRISN